MNRKCLKNNYIVPRGTINVYFAKQNNYLNLFSKHNVILLLLTKFCNYDILFLVLVELRAKVKGV